MEKINVTKARQNLFQIISDVNQGYNPINIVNNNGQNAILIAESDWNAIEETLYLNSIPNYADLIEKARKEDRTKATVYKKGEKW